MEFEVRMTLSVEDQLAVFRAGKVHFKNRPKDAPDTSLRPSRGKTVLLWAVGLAAFVVGYFVRGIHWMLGGLLAFMSGVLFTLVLLYRASNSEKSLRKRFAKNESTGELRVIHFSDDGFQNSIVDRETRYSYRAIQAVYETDEYFILFVTKTTAEAVRKSAFTTGAPADFADFIQQKTGLTVQYLK